MNYRIKITRTEPNPHFAEELKAHEERNRGYNTSFNNNGSYPLAEVETTGLLCELTEEQFKAIKAAVLKEFI